MNIGMNAFVNGGADEALLKSLAEDERYQGNEELEKALKKEGLVQVQTTVNGKHGTYTRMQWKKASDVKSTDRVVGGQPQGATGGKPASHDKSECGKFEDLKVDKTTTPATVSFKFKGKTYTATDGKNFTFHVRSSTGERTKISGKLKASDNGYIRVGTYPLGSMDNVLDVSSAKEAPGASEEKKPSLEQKVNANPSGWRRHEHGAMSYDGTLHAKEGSTLEDLVEEVSGSNKFDFSNEAGPHLDNALSKDYPDMEYWDVDSSSITSAKVKGDKVQVTAKVKLTVDMEDGTSKKDERTITFSVPYKSKGTAPHD